MDCYASVAEEIESAVTPGTLFLSLEQCQRLDGALREEMELLDYDLRSALTSVAAEASRSGVDHASFMTGASSVLLSIAATLLERAATQTQRPLDVESFVDGARSAAQWAGERRLRYGVAGEG